jgi:hypothetical protein
MALGLRSFFPSICDADPVEPSFLHMNFKLGLALISGRDSSSVALIGA